MKQLSRYKIPSLYGKKNKKNYKTVDKTKTAWMFLAAGFSGTMLFHGIPFLDVIVRSFRDPSGMGFSGLSNYKTVLDNASFKIAAENTCRFIITAVPVLLTGSFGLAACLKTVSGKKGQVLRTLFLLPMVLPVSSLAFVWKLLFHRYGIINHCLVWLGMEAVDFLNTGKSFFVLIFTYIWRNGGYAMVLWLAALDRTEKEIFEAARMDGADKKQILFYVTLPLLIPSAFTILILSVLNSFKVFRDAYLISGEYPEQSIYFLQHLFNNWFVKLDFEKMAAAATMTAVCIGILTGGLLYGLEKQKE